MTSPKLDSSYISCKIQPKEILQQRNNCRAKLWNTINVFEIQIPLPFYATHIINPFLSQPIMIKCRDFQPTVKSLLRELFLYYKISFIQTLCYSLNLNVSYIMDHLIASPRTNTNLVYLVTLIHYILRFFF